jgi:tRNA uridine 5-carboxymethylaminomethyl modification enzyme
MDDETDEVNSLLSAMESAELKEKVSLHNLLKRPELDIEKIKTIDSRINDTLSVYSTDILEQAEIQVKYASYVDKEYQLAEKMNHLEKIKIPKNINYTSMPALSNEAKEKLTKLKPETLGQASRISGISPADISVLLVYLHR